ncbi:MAG TPA: hypothetical protein VFN78_04960 [Ktedonobacterales bacterium]|nr:hypothetical protein [Ktedonobacterales bacterium]
MSWRIKRPAVHAALVIPALLLVTACGAASTPGTQPTATATAQVTCASAVPGAAAIDLQHQGFLYPIVFPPGTVGTTPQQTASGTGLFTVYSFTACTPSTTTAGVTTFFSSHLGALQHGWLDAQTFPSDGGLMSSCGASGCWFNPKGGPLYYLTFDQYADKGAGIITYRARWAVSPDFPTCSSNYSASGAARDVYFLPAYAPPLPLPPLSSVVPDDAMGGLRGYDICSPGTAQSVSAFMTKEASVTGWTKITAVPACFYSTQCWQNGSAVISWNADSDPLNWHIAWRMSLP